MKELTWADDVTLNGSESEFYTMKQLQEKHNHE